METEKMNRTEILKYMNGSYITIFELTEQNRNQTENQTDTRISQKTNFSFLIYDQKIINPTQLGLNKNSE